MEPASAFRALIAGVGLWLAFPTPGGAQADPVVLWPDVNVGDRWTYRRMDYWHERPTGVYERRVTFVGSHAIYVVNKEEGREDSDSTYPSEWNTVAATHMVFYPHTGYLKFPLKP